MPRRKSRSINTVIDVFVNEIVELGVFGFNFLRKKIGILALGELIEDTVEHWTDVVFAIVDDLFRFLIPEHRDAVAALVLLVRFEVDFMEVRAAEEVVDGRLGVLVVALWKLPSGPAAFVAFGVWFDD